MPSTLPKKIPSNPEWDNLLNRVSYTNDELLLLFENLISTSLTFNIDRFLNVTLGFGIFFIKKDNKKNISIDCIYKQSNPSESFIFNAFLWGMYTDFINIPLEINTENVILQKIIKWRLLINK
jgi:hypothetical protein